MAKPKIVLSTRTRAKQDKPATSATTFNPSKPTSPISSDEFTPDGKYVSLSSRLESYWNKTKSELSEKLRELLPDNWDYADLDLRKRWVWLYDYQHDPAKEEKRARDEQAWQNLGYFRAMAACDYGSVSSWDYWASQKYLIPRETACLMFELEPKNYDHVKSSNKLWVKKLADVIDKIERSATRDTEGAKLSPAEWIEWAQSKGYAVPGKFKKAVAEVESKAKEAGANTAGKEVDTNTEKPNSDYDPILQKLAQEEAVKLQAAGEDNKKESVATKVAKRLDKEEAYKHYRHLSNQAIERRIRRTWKLNRR